VLRWVPMLLALAAGCATAQATPLDRARALPEGSLRTSLEHLAEVAERPSIVRRHGDRWARRLEASLAQAEAGRDPYHTLERGRVALRAYRSDLSEALQGYGVYVPPDFDPRRRYPVLVALHGGSSNGLLFCGLVLGARVPFAQYRDHWHATLTPRLAPDRIVVCPDGFGNAMWRWMGERDVFDVIDDLARAYPIDRDQIVLGGLSNGGLGSFNVGLRHAWRFAAVVPMAGAPGWMHYLGGVPRGPERRVLEPWSAMLLLPNSVDTHLHVHHGRRDPGVMQPAHIEALERLVRAEGWPVEVDWYAAGHDLVRPVARGGSFFRHLDDRRRLDAPDRVRLRTGDYRAARQHWVEVTRIADYPRLVTVRAARDGDAVTVETEGPVVGLRLHLEGPTTIAIGGRRLRGSGPVELFRDRGGPWRLGHAPARGKRPRLSGPLPDVFYEPAIHVYGTQDPARTPLLRAAAEQGARSWVPHTRGIRQPVLPDSALTPALLADHAVVLYGSRDDHAVLARLDLPIAASGGVLTLGDRRFAGPRVGARFILPNPLAPTRYLVVQTGTSARAVLDGDRLPAFLGDYVVYDGRHLPASGGNLFGRRRPLAAGFFDDAWRLPGPG
jgi:predicted esterase